MDDEHMKVLVCGGGNAAHTLCGVASSRKNVDCIVLDVFADEAERWTNALGADDFVINSTKNDKSVEVIKGKPTLITNDPKSVVPDSDLIVLAVPAFAHENYFKVIAPYVQPNTIIIGLPSQPGFEFQCFDILQEIGDKVAVVSFETLPWVCRVEEFGRKSNINGTKNTLGCSLIMRNSKPKFEPIAAMSRLLGKYPELYMFNNYLSPTLNQHLVHSSILYGKWAPWDGKPLDEIPLFYQGLNQLAADVLSDTADEMMLITKNIMEKRPNVKLNDVMHSSTWYKQSYEDYITDFTDLLSMIRSNKAYEGLTHPTKKTAEGKYVPDFEHRYFTEDTPFAVVIKGIALCVGVGTPNIDNLLIWCQEKTGKEYIVDGKLTGKDVKDTRAPQRYGLDTLDDLVKLV